VIALHLLRRRSDATCTRARPPWKALQRDSGISLKVVMRARAVHALGAYECACVEL
jgi:hypothetical protein